MIQHSYRIALALSATLTVTACQQKEVKPVINRTVVAPPAQADGQAFTMTLPGEVQPRYVTPLSFRVAGKILDRKVRLGDRVSKGQVLAILDAADLARSTAGAQAQFTAAQHRLEFAQQQLERDRAQGRENLIAKAQLEQSLDAYALALAQRNQAEQQLALAKNQQQYATLVAEHDGFVTAEQADTGQNVSAGQPIYQLAWTGNVDVITDVPENSLGSIVRGQATSVTITALPGRKFDAKVREIAPAADPQSRTYRVRMTLDNPDNVVLGMTASVAFQRADDLEKKLRVKLPATALFHDGQLPAVWVVQPKLNTLELRRVTVAHYGENNIVLSQGVQVGERVVTQGVHTVSKGEKVQPVALLHAEATSS